MFLSLNVRERDGGVERKRERERGDYVYEGIDWKEMKVRERARQREEERKENQGSLVMKGEDSYWKASE